MQDGSFSKKSRVSYTADISSLERQGRTSMFSRERDFMRS